MTTELERFTQAYATMTVAMYEPLILRWYSKLATWTVADSVARRTIYLQEERPIPIPTPQQAERRIRVRPGIQPELDEILREMAQAPELDIDTERAEELQRDLTEGHLARLRRILPSLEIRDGIVLPTGVLTVDGAQQETGLPVITRTGDPTPAQLPELPGLRGRLMAGFTEVLANAVASDNSLTASALRRQLLDVATAQIGAAPTAALEFLPVEGELNEALSPIGIAHYFRQLYFNAGEGFGPIEEAFTVAPAETLEVVYETVRRQSHEEVLEVGTEVVSETATEEKNLDEVSDKVSSMVQRDNSAAMSANANVAASGGIGVWNVSANATFGATADLKTSSKRSQEIATRKLKETTKRASERITKTYTLRTRDVLDITTTNLTRRVISNTTAFPVNYGLRRVFRRVVVKVQRLGPQLVWQLYIRNPGQGLAQSQFVHFMAAQPIANPAAPPATKPRPAGGTDTGSTSAALNYDSGRKAYYVTLVIPHGSERKPTAVSIDSVSDLEGGGKSDLAPSARNDLQWDQKWDTTNHTFTVKIGIKKGDARSVQVNYTYVYEAGPSVLEAWEKEKVAAQAEFEKAAAEARNKALREQFDRDRELITQRSKIRSRPANDLRREERYEVMSRMVSYLFGSMTDGVEPSPLEIELFHRYFDIEAMFVYTHPSWWRPRYSPTFTGFGRPSYEITAESEPAPMGSSLGWVIQLDGDDRRNEFLNSPWSRICMPMRPSREREAISWLANHLEGEIGYDPGSGPLKSLLEEIEEIRRREGTVGAAGPDYVTVSSTVGAPSSALTPQDIYPVVDEFEVTVPTDGFVYDELKIKGSSRFKWPFTFP